MQFNEHLVLGINRSSNLYDSVFVYFIDRIKYAVFVFIEELN